ncbi:MAG: hypothetical protein NTY19_22080 [Planctomycetota bacterium]|nr:hypothetical protein [Planctomycetota bacterium]
MLNHRFTQIVWITFPILLVVPLLAQDALPAKKPVPDSTALAQATKLIKEVYGDDFSKAKSADQKVALAKKMLQKAGETRNDPNAMYALLNVSKDIAVLAGNTDTAFAATDAMSQSFEVKPLELKKDVLMATSKKARLPAEHGAIAKQSLTLMEAAVAADNYDLAAQVGQLGLAEARLAPKSLMIQPILARLRETKGLADAYESMQKAAAVLEQTPTDPGANLAVGKYLCLVKGNWQKGISKLALGNDEKLKALANKELQGVSDADGQVALGDGWWDLASTSGSAGQKQLRARACYWYQKALPGLTGLVKDKVEKRIQQLPMPSVGLATRPSAVSQSQQIDLLSLLPDSERGNQGFSLTDKDKLLFPYEPPAEYDLEFTFTRGDGPDANRKSGRGDVMIFLPVGGQSPVLCFRYGKNESIEVFFFPKDQGKKILANLPPGPMIWPSKHTVLVEVRHSEIRGNLDGKRLFAVEEFAGLHSGSSTQLGFFLSPGCRASLHQVQVREVMGKGKTPGPPP